MTFEDFFKEWKNEKDFIIAHTSGSTGSPKIIRLPKSFVIDSARRTIDFFKLDKSSLLHSCVSSDFIGGKMMAVRAEIANAKFSWEKPSNIPLTTLDQSIVIDLLAVVPSQMIYIVENKNSLPYIKNIIVGGSPVHNDLRNKIAESNLNAYETYGMTETASHIALRKITKEIVPFKTLSGINVDKNEDGCLKIFFDNGSVISTNDIAEIVSSREFYIKGRRDNIFISGGRKINPLEIEEKISSLFDVPFCITAFSDEKWGDKIVLLIEEGLEVLENEKYTKSNLLSALKEKLKSWECPKEIYFVINLPRTPNGKIIRIKDPSCLSFVSPYNDHDVSRQKRQE